MVTEEEEEGGLHVLGGVCVCSAARTARAQTDERHVRVCVCLPQWVCLSPPGALLFLREYVCAFPSYVLLTIWSRSPFLNDKSEAVRDS